MNAITEACDKKRGRRRTMNHVEVITYAQQHLELFQDAIAKHFGLTQCHVSRILTAAGVDSTAKSQGNHVKLKRNQTRNELYWEKRLLKEGLGMDRGCRIGTQRLLYGHKDESTFKVAT